MRIGTLRTWHLGSRCLHPQCTQSSGCPPRSAHLWKRWEAACLLQHTLQRDAAQLRKRTTAAQQCKPAGPLAPADLQSRIVPSPVSSSKLSMSNTVRCCSFRSPRSSCWLKSQSYSLRQQGKRGGDIRQTPRPAACSILPQSHRPTTRSQHTHRQRGKCPQFNSSLPLTGRPSPR